MSKRLIRQCKCSNVMVVEVDFLPNWGWKAAYRQVECMQGCCLGIGDYGPYRIHGFIWAVLCSRCIKLRHLSKFEEVIV